MFTLNDRGTFTMRQNVDQASTINTQATWVPETPAGQIITSGQRLFWADLNRFQRPRWVTVSHVDDEEGIVICRDDTGTHLMAVPEELSE